jgi:hypothetical protein
MELKLNSMKIFELGEYITKFLAENGLTKENDLVIKVTKDELKKIDEDLYYRNKPKGEDFIPSDNDVIVKFENLNIIFTVEEEKREE